MTAILWPIVVLALSLLWRRASPTPSTKPTPTSNDSETLTMISRMFLDMQRETRSLVLDLVQGRVEQQSSPQVTVPTENERQITYDYDSTPLHPGILAVEEREAEEQLQEVSLRERRVLQERMAELARLEEEKKQILSDLEEASPGPWNGQGSVHDLT